MNVTSISLLPCLFLLFECPHKIQVHYLNTKILPTVSIRIITVGDVTSAIAVHAAPVPVCGIHMASQCWKLFVDI